MTFAIIGVLLMLAVIVLPFVALVMGWGQSGSTEHVHLEAIAEVRRAYAARGDSLDDLPDEAVARLAVTQHVNLRLAVRDLGRAFLRSLPLRRHT